MHERNEIDGWAFAGIATLFACSGGIVALDTVSCLTIGLREPMPVPVDVSGTFDGFGRSSTNTPIAPFILGRNCVDAQSFLIGDGDPKTNSWFGASGRWEGPLPLDGSFVHFISPTEKVKDVRIINTATGEIFQSK